LEGWGGVGGRFTVYSPAKQKRSKVRGCSSYILVVFIQLLDVIVLQYKIFRLYFETNRFSGGWFCNTYLTHVYLLVCTEPTFWNCPLLFLFLIVTWHKALSLSRIRNTMFDAFKQRKEKRDRKRWAIWLLYTKHYTLESCISF
jgi:hypothetical protein